MLQISDHARKRRQIIKMNVQKIFASEQEKFDKIWSLILENEKEERYDSPFTNKILNNINNLSSLQKFLNDVFDNPELIGELRKPRVNPNSSVDTLTNNLKNLNIKQRSTASNALREPPICLEYFERFREGFSIGKYEQFFTVSKAKTRVDDEDKFCDTDLAKAIVDEKEEMGQYTEKQKHIMRQSANPYEKVKRAFFQNREALKLAALDRMFDFALSDESDPRIRLSKNPVDHRPRTNELSRDKDTFFFADVGGGPGSHAEFILWRKGYYNAKGFGFTMKSKYPTQPNNMGDYNRKDFAAGSFAFFDTYYGVKGNGDICDPENLKSFEAFVKAKTDGKGVHLVIGDAAVDPEGRETRQELYHNRIFLCEFTAALSLCRIDEGNFVCKLYDTVTPFTVGLIYLMWIAFDKIAICKPVSVRPACSEKFLVCQKLTKMGATIIKDYLTFVNEQFDKLPDGMDISQVVPKRRLYLETRFIKFMMEHNQKVFQAQIDSLQFYKKCLKNSSLAPKNQEQLRIEALAYWNIPDISRATVEIHENVNEIFKKLSREFNLKRFYHLFACKFQEVFETFKPNLPGTRVILSDFAIQMLNHKEHRILISDDRGYIHLIQPGIPEIKRVKNAELHGFPPRSIVLIEYKKDLFGPESQNYPVQIVDAAVLAGDEIAFLPIFSRLKYAKKFAQNIVFRFDGKILDLKVTSVFPLNVNEIKRIDSINNGILKIYRLYTKDFKTVWNKEKQCEEIMDSLTLNVVAERQKYSTFWDNLSTSCKISNWRDSRSDFIDKITEVHHKFCIANDLSFT